MKKRYEYYKDGEWRTCPRLSAESQEVVEDLMNSANITQHWSKEKQREYFERVISIVCDLAVRKPKTKIDRLFETLKEKFFYLISRFVIYVP